jgi:hypothetical protein
MYCMKQVCSAATVEHGAMLQQLHAFERRCNERSLNQFSGSVDFGMA